MHPLSRIVLAFRPVQGRRGRRRAGLAPVQDVLAGIQERFDGEWLAPLRAADGGYFGLLHRLDHAFDIAVALREAVWPSSVEVVVATLPAGGKDAGADLTRRARERAREALADGEARRDWFRLDVPGRARADVALAQAVARLHATVAADWTANRAQAVRSYRHHGRQSEVARELGISQQAVSQLLLGASFKDLVRAERAIREWLRGSGRPGLWPLPGRGGLPAQER